MFFYAMALGLRMLCVWFWGLFCFGLPGPCFGVGLGLGLVFWAMCTDFGFWLAAVCGWLGLVCWFCLESLILAQDERWRRA